MPCNETQTFCVVQGMSEPMTTPEAKGYRGLGMEGFIARWYARTTQKDLSEYVELAQRITHEFPPGSTLLDVAPGPGYLAIELAAAGRAYDVSGLDISRTFVAMAQQKARDRGVTVDFMEGNAAVMPYGQDTFDLVVCRAAFKNFSEPIRALLEMYRVLKPGKTAMIIDLRRDVSWDAVTSYVDGLGLGFWNALVTRWTFKLMLIKRAYTREQMQAFVSQTPFKRAFITETPIGFELRLQK
jgi:ubiquinone/menaquinone biosynthesis C-methylase UbiE